MQAGCDPTAAYFHCAAEAATKYSKLVEAARFQPSAFRAQLLDERREHGFDFNRIASQNFFASCKEVTDKESMRRC